MRGRLGVDGSEVEGGTGGVGVGVGVGGGGGGGGVVGVTDGRRYVGGGAMLGGTGRLGGVKVGWSGEAVWMESRKVTG